MKVRDLIQRLRQFDPDLEVVIAYHDDQGPDFDIPVNRLAFGSGNGTVRIENDPEEVAIGSPVEAPRTGAVTKIEINGAIWTTSQALPAHANLSEIRALLECAMRQGLNRPGSTFEVLIPARFEATEGFQKLLRLPQCRVTFLLVGLRPPSIPLLVNDPA